MPIVHWHDFEGRDRDKTFLLDVRTAAEYARGTIDNAVNIPVDNLRKRLGELPTGKEIWVFCQVGLRGHVATRMLLQRGYAARNLTGGYKTWKTATAGMRRAAGGAVHNKRYSFGAGMQTVVTGRVRRPAPTLTANAMHQ